MTNGEVIERLAECKRDAGHAWQSISDLLTDLGDEADGAVSDLLLEAQNAAEEMLSALGNAREEVAP